ncbi:MAG: DUF5032 domain-containing protein [Bacteroidales bacterium]|nr:DUF5032 domain-containing protein [Bacteroidales bacterium]
MKRVLFFGLLSFFVLSSCKDDNGEILPSLNKVTRVICYKDGNSEPDGSLEIVYNSQGDVDQMKVYKGREYVRSYHYRINSSSVSVSYTDFSNGSPVNYSPEGYRSFILGSGRVGTEKIKELNDLSGVTQETYIKETWAYFYSGSWLTGGNWTLTWPNETGGGYTTRSYPGALSYTYKSGNLNTFSYKMTYDMSFEYTEIPTPSNFPLRIIRLIDLDTWDIVDPLNFYYGSNSGKLPAKVTLVEVPNVSTPIEEYTFDFRTLNEYVTEMYITRVKDGTTSSYKYTFEYNYKPSF